MAEPRHRRDRRRAAAQGAGREAELPVEALRRAAEHARRAAAESAAALHALLDAASLFADGRPAAESSWLAPAAELLAGLGSSARGAGGAAPEVMDALAAALDAEIQRWEQRSRVDAEARAVLRALIGVRELLWELGVRKAGTADADAAAAPRAHPVRTRPRAAARDPFAGAAPDLFEASR